MNLKQGGSIFVCALGLCMPSPLRAESVINGGTSAWLQAVQASRADMLILGDSVTWSGGYGWDEGMTKAASDRFGLAGTGLVGDTNVTGQGYGYGTYGGVNWGNGYAAGAATVPENRRGYVNPLLLPDTAGSQPIGGFTMGLFGDGLEPSAGHNWHLYTASPASGGSIGALRRVNGQVNGVWYPTVQVLDAVPTATPAKGLQETVFHFDAQPHLAGMATEFRLHSMTNTSIFYSRVLSDENRGATVSSLGYGGRNTHDFYDDVLGAMSSEGRAAYFSALVSGGSGKLNVMIAEGFNDRVDRRMSVNNVAQGDTPEGFRDNIQSLIALVRSGWLENGFELSDLSFTLVGMYETDLNNGPLIEYAKIQEELAKADAQISFVDLMSLAPSYEESVALGYMLDGVHPTAKGAQAFSDLVTNALVSVPEPSCLAAGVALVGMLGRRRRSDVRQTAVVLTNK